MFLAGPREDFLQKTSTINITHRDLYTVHPSKGVLLFPGDMNGLKISPDALIGLLFGLLQTLIGFVVIWQAAHYASRLRRRKDHFYPTDSWH